MSDLFLKNTIDYNFKNVTADIHTMHKTIIDKLNFFIENNKIPHIVLKNTVIIRVSLLLLKTRTFY